MCDEIWRPVVGYEGLYEVSDKGRVRSLFSKRGKVLSPAKSMGYPYVNLSRDGRPRFARIHVLVAAAFIGECPDGHEVNHKDSDRTNNNVSNLEYVTHAQNVLHAVASGKFGKLSPDQAQAIRDMAPEEIDTKLLAEQYDVSRDAILCVLNYKTFSKFTNGSDSSPKPIRYRHACNKLFSEERMLMAQAYLDSQRTARDAQEIGERFGVSYRTVYRAVKVYQNIPLR